MTKEDLRDCQLRQLDALKYIDSLCDNNALKYYVHTGTLLGAVRHHGFIPWDMDIDLLMPENDCKQLLELIDNDNQTEYSVAKVEEGYLGADRVVLNNTKCYLPSDTVTDGRIHIGITCLVNAKRYPDIIKRVLNYLAILLINVVAYRHGMTTLDRQKKGYYLKKATLTIMNSLLEGKSDNDVRKMIRSLAVSSSETGLVTVFNSFYGFAKETYPKDYYSSTSYVDFEDIKVPVPCGFEHILENLYGDWKKMPEENKRYPQNLDLMIYEKTSFES